jgi:uncharacterized repeat protein (TIGR03803 family)
MNRLLLITAIAAVCLSACSQNRFTPAASNGAAANGITANDLHATSAQYKLLHAFKGTPDGASPLAGLVVFKGKLYGTTLNGSQNYCSASCGGNHCYLGCGTVFSITDAGKERIVYNFKGDFNNAGDGAWPYATLIALNGTFYGTTGGGGTAFDGSVFSATKSGKEKVLYSFTGGNDGSDPEANLINVKGTLYGTTVYGGSTNCNGSGCGTVYKITTAGKEGVLYAFTGGNDGYRVFAPLTYWKGNFYGATLQGGGTGCGGDGCGTIFEMSLSGKETVIYRFAGTPAGAFPNGLTAVKGVLYGTTEGGGAENSGTFFSITPKGAFTALYSFLDIPDGNLPGATLLYANGEFYGTTVGGGTSGNGTVFQINSAGGESVLYSFLGGSDGADPQAPVIEKGRTLYSTTYKGGGAGCGGYGCGTVFSVTP